MAITKKNEGRFTIIDVNQKTEKPVQDVLQYLSNSGNGNEYKSNCIIDLTSLKPSRLSEDELNALFHGLPAQDRRDYFIAVPEKILDRSREIASGYIGGQYKIVNKTSAMMMANQRD